MNPQIKTILDVLVEQLDQKIKGIYLCGSAVLGGLKVNSDLDFLVVVSSSLESSQREQLIKSILPHSRKIGENSDLRYVEVTIVTESSLKHWNHPTWMDLIYGEWLRDAYLDGYVPQSEINPDLTIQLYQARQHCDTLWGDNPLDFWLPDLPFTDVEKAILDSLEELVSGAKGDEINCILTLCRMIDTLESKQIHSKAVSGIKAVEKFPEYQDIILEAVKTYEQGIEPKINEDDYREVIKNLHRHILRSK
ncbi:MAG: DUF4111 domain-containing protein [Erysipelothrix sp.]